MKTRKVVIIGAGHVGPHVALGLIQSGEADDIVLIDILKEKAAAQALDLDDCVSGALCGHDAVIRAGEYEELNDADIMVVAFGRSRKPGETRLDMFDDTIRMANEVIGHLKQVDFKGIRISISNPADIICEYIRQKERAANPRLLHRHQPGNLPPAARAFSRYRLQPPLHSGNVHGRTRQQQLYCVVAHFY